MKLNKGGKQLILTVIFMIVALFTIKYWLNMPVVYWSTSKNECVSIWIDGKEYGCENMPEKYERVYVK